ncbi:MAG TPA: hypothetical protein VD927_09970 [Chryseosolibacter sp.]|nr:hypothetical protein [Chryseosolibacter sp.]
MRHLSYILLALLTGCDGCKLDDPQPAPKTELEKLPPATQEGKNTFGCLVNGKAWYTVSSTRASAVYQSGILSISGTVIKPAVQDIAVNLEEDGGLIQENVEYQLTSIPYNRASIFFSLDCQYEADDTIFGTLMLTKFDKTNYIVSGIFSFETFTANCDTLKVTHGRFDIKYIP